MPTVLKKLMVVPPPLEVMGNPVEPSKDWCEVTPASAEVDVNYKDMVIYYYSDGTTKKGFIIK